MPAPPCLAVNPSSSLQQTRERHWGSPSPSSFPGLSSSLGEHLPTHGVRLAPTFEANPVNPKSTHPKASQLKLLQISIKTFRKTCTLSKKSVPGIQVSILSFNPPLAGIPPAKSQSEGFKGTWGCTRAPFSLVVGKLLYLSKPLCVPLTGRDNNNTRRLGELSPRCSPQGPGPPTPVSVNGSVTAVITLSSAVSSPGHLGGRTPETEAASSFPEGAWRSPGKGYPGRQEPCVSLGVHRSRWQVTHTSVCPLSSSARPESMCARLFTHRHASCPRPRVPRERRPHGVPAALSPVRLPQPETQDGGGLCSWPPTRVHTARRAQCICI